MTRRILNYGDRAILIEVGTLDEVLSLSHALNSSKPDGVVDIVPAARTVAVTVDPALLPLSVAAKWARDAVAVPTVPDSSERVVIDVEYSGQDLEAVAGILGITQRQVVEIHTASEWRVAFTGFAPGFGYLVTDHHRLDVPRRALPRTSVPRGAVGLAGEFCGIYPRSSPGGWQLIGRTDAALWDSNAPQPALLSPGSSVSFRSV
jgi:KipI family sensor histidine kinase inhibitor